MYTLAFAALVCTTTSCQQENVAPTALEGTSISTDASMGSRSYKTHLYGREEVPAVNTNATGQLNLKLSKDGTMLEYKLIVANMETVRFGHLHYAAAGSNGPVVVDLVGRTAPNPKGVIAEGVITAASLKGPLAGMSLANLIAEIEAGMIYANVHSDQYPGGEIRGQVD